MSTILALNYPDLLRGIRLELFTGETAAVYPLACALACLAALAALLTAYDAFVNSPVPHLDVRRLLGTVAAVILTCNFTWVLVPLDSVCSLVSKSVAASVELRRESVSSRTAEALSDCEARSSTGTLEGAFEEELETESGSVSEAGESASTSPVLESVTEDLVERQGGARGFLRRAWEALSLAASMQMGRRCSNISTVLSWTLSQAVAVVKYLLISTGGVYLVVLGFMGPFTMALSILPGRSGNLRGWFSRYVQISLWPALASLVDYVNLALKDALLEQYWAMEPIVQAALPVHIIILDLVLLATLLAVPKLSTWVVATAASGALGDNRGVLRTAAMAGRLAA